MKDTSNDSDRPNPILDYPGYYMPGFFSWLLGEIPRFGLPDWGPIPQLPRERPVTPPSRSPELPPAHEVDPPDRPPEWLFGPPRIVQASPFSRQTVAEAMPSNTIQQSPKSLADFIIDRVRRMQQQNAGQTEPSAFAAGSAPLRFSSPTTLPRQGYEPAEDNPSQDKSPIRRLTRVWPV